MKACVKIDKRPELFIQEVDIPRPKSDEALIRVDAAGLCGTDVAIRNNSFMGRHGEVQLPIIPGHEFCGEVVEIGSRARKVDMGDRVITSGIKGCGKCGLLPENLFLVVEGVAEPFANEFERSFRVRLVAKKGLPVFDLFHAAGSFVALDPQREHLFDIIEPSCILIMNTVIVIIIFSAGDELRERFFPFIS